jgi:hypothetical protein
MAFLFPETSIVNRELLTLMICNATWGEKVCGNAQMSTKRFLCQRKTVGELKKDLQSCETGIDSKKRLGYLWAVHVGNVS